MRAPVAANGWPTATRAALDVELRAVDGAQRRGETEPVAAELRRLPGFQRAQHLRREGLVDLVEVEVLQA